MHTTSLCARLNGESCDVMERLRSFSVAQRNLFFLRRCLRTMPLFCMRAHVVASAGKVVTRGLERPPFGRLFNAPSIHFDIPTDVSINRRLHHARGTHVHVRKFTASMQSAQRDTLSGECSVSAYTTIVRFAFWPRTPPAGRTPAGLYDDALARRASARECLGDSQPRALMTDEMWASGSDFENCPGTPLFGSRNTPTRFRPGRKGSRRRR